MPKPKKTAGFENFVTLHYPYTALKLWEVQKITACTKVRRGEAEWQKAGEKSELAKYLSEK